MTVSGPIILLGFLPGSGVLEKYFFSKAAASQSPGPGSARGQRDQLAFLNVFKCVLHLRTYLIFTKDRRLVNCDIISM